MATKKPKISVWEFKKGQRLHLDTIYTIQGLGGYGGNWWSSVDEDGNPDDGASDEIIILRDIRIEIRITDSAD